MSDDANSLFAQQAQLESKRASWDPWWQQIMERVLPSQAQVTVLAQQEGKKTTERQFDSRAVFANERFAAVLDNLLTPRTQVYHGILPEDGDVTGQESKIHLERVNKALFTERYRPRANFASQKIQGYLSVGAIGNSCLFIDEEVGVGPRYIGVHMREVYWAQTQSGVIDTLYRKFPMCAIHAVKFFERLKVTLPDKIVQAAKTSPYTEFDFLHCVRPNDDRKAGRKDFRGMPWASYYAIYEGRQMLSVGGYEEWPYAIGRYHLGVGESYARSPAMTAWPAICTLNEEKKTILRMGQREVEPPVLLQEDGVLEGFDMRNGALNYGGISSDGVVLAQPFKTGGNVPLGLELMELEGKDVDAAFLTDIQRVLLDHPDMTIPMMLELVQHKATCLSAAGARHESEDLGPLIQRELGILKRMSKYSWILDEMPDELRQINGAFKIDYRSPLSRAARASDGAAIVNSFESLATASQLDPDVAVVVDVKGAYRELIEINGMPAKFIRDEKEVAKILANKEAREQAVQAASMAPEMAQAALNTAKAQSIRSGQGGA